MYDWNGNGKYDKADSYIDYHVANSGKNSGDLSNLGAWLLIAVITGVCPPLGIIIFIGIMLFG